MLESWDQMIKDTRRDNWAKILTIAVVIAIVFIWGHSLIPGKYSKDESNFFLDIINNFFINIGIDFQMTSFIIRKMAHFTEYFILGALLLTTLRLYVDKIADKIFHILFIGLLVPVIDEFIQLFVDGRGGEIRDVIIDFSGVMCGMILSYLIIKVTLNKRKKYKLINK